MFENQSFRAITDKSENLSDLKDVNVKKFSSITKKKEHIEFYCRLHFIDRMKNYCHRDSLLDVMLSGIDSIKFSSLDNLDMEQLNEKCKCCDVISMFRVDRID